MLEKSVSALVDILKVKTLITLVMVFTACYLALVGRIDVSVFIGLVTSVITYYFTKKEGQDK